LRRAVGCGWSGKRVHVPTSAIVAPIGFTVRLADHAALGGHLDRVRPPDRPWPLRERPPLPDEGSAP